MTRDRWARLERIYHAALEQPPQDRAAFLRTETADDVELLAEIEALLPYAERSAAFTEHSAMELAARALVAQPGQPDREAHSGTIGSYEILRLLGTGGMGQVYLAHDSRLARYAAVKVLRPDCADPGWIAALRQEALAASGLNHPNILTIYEIGEHDDTSFIAAEYVDGVTLRARLKQGSVSALELAGIALQIAEGLAAAHERGVVHRDIKPDNLMLRADNLVKILDFGIATRTGADASRRLSAFADGAVIGTTGYMSPEQRQGRPVDARTDVWSLGVVIYEMATGRLPAQSTIGRDELAGLAPELAPIVGRALARNPVDRYATAGELARDLRVLRRTLEEPPAEVAGPSQAKRPRAGGLSLLTRIGAAALVPLAVSAYFVVVAGRDHETPARLLAGSDETRDPAAYQLYAKGRYHVQRRTPDDLRKGIEYLREAVGLDPRYGRAHAVIAEAHILLAMTSDVAPKVSFPEARAAAERALAIDPELSEARVSMGIIKFWFDWDWSGAAAEFRRAIAGTRPDPAAHTFYGHLLSNLGDHTGALQEMRRALDYEPHSPLINALFAQTLSYQGRDDDALERLHKALDLDPKLWLTHNIMGRIYARKGMYREALQALDRATELGGSLIVRAMAGHTFAVSGNRDKARAILEELKVRAAQAYVPPSNLALVHLGLGEHDEALDRLEEALETRDLLLTFLTVEPRWSDLDGNPRFTALLGRVGLKR